MSKKLLAITGGFVPFNDTVTLLSYKHLRLIDADIDVVALKGPTDEGLKNVIEADLNARKFHIEYVCNYDEAVATFEKKNVIQGIFNIFKYKKECVRKSLKQDYGIVYSSSIPSFTHWAAYQVKKKNPNIKWIASFSDPLYKSPYKFDKETLNEYSLITKIGFYVYIGIYMNAWYEKIAMKYADKIIYICEEQRDFMISHYKNKDSLMNKSLIVPLNYIKDWDIYSKLMNQDLNIINEKKVFSHFGRVYGLRKIDLFLLALKELKEEEENFAEKIIFRQYGEFNSRYMKMIDNYGISDLFEFSNKISYDQVIDMMKQSDVVVLFDTILSRDELQPYLPSKSLEYILLRKEIFILTIENSPSNRIFRNLGYKPTLYELDNIKKAIKELIGNDKIEYSYDTSMYENSIATKKLKEYIESKLV